MNSEHVRSITAVTNVFADGQKCIGVILEYDKAVARDGAGPDTFRIEGRTITDVTVRKTPDGEAGAGNFICIDLSKQDEKAATYFPGMPWKNICAELIPAQVILQQIEPVLAEDGEMIPPFGPASNDQIRNLLTESFTQGSFEGLDYNLFLPNNYNPEKKYPLVLFIHDAGVCSFQTECALAQGMGAVVWTTEECQKKHECMVLAPQFAPPAIVEDDWSVDERLETAKRLLDQITKDYSVDTDRMYTTGQSMGCMSSMVLNLRYPELFAASFFVAGQWDERAFRGSGLQNKKFWFLNSMGDAKAFPGMNQILVTLEQEGAKVAREVWKTNETQEVYREKTQKLIDTGADIIYTPFEITTVANGWHSNGGEHHITTWQFAYNIEAIWDWMFEQKKER